MQINTAFDTKSELLTINSGTTAASDSGTVTTANSGSDTADWSSAALSLADSDTSGLVSPVLKLKAQNEILQQHLTTALASKLEEAGIDMSQPVTLTRDENGTVTVVGDNDDKAAIEAIFADESSLSEAFNTLADNSELARSYTKTQTASLVRTNGYAAYLDQLGNTTSEGSSGTSFYLSLLGGDSATYFS